MAATATKTDEAGASSQNRDVIVIGASMGGVHALQRIFAELPADLPAAVFVVLHTHPFSASDLPSILSRRGPLRASHAIHGQKIENGHVYVAPPDNQLMLRPGMVQVVRGPKENNHRPAVDALFRTASRYYGPRVIGVVLTGYLDCGTAGMLSIKARNGVAVVQDPNEAEAPDMPRSVLAHVEVDHVVPLEEVGPLLAHLAREAPAPWPETFARQLAELEGDQLGVPISTVCPHCEGSLTRSEVNGFELLRCHVGHAFSPMTSANEQEEQVERALWSAVRALEESAALADHMAATSGGEMKQRYEEKADNHRENAERLQSMLLGSSPKVEPEAGEDIRSRG